MGARTKEVGHPWASPAKAALFLDSQKPFVSQSSQVIAPCDKEEEESALLHPTPHQSGKGQNQSPSDAVKGVGKRPEKAILHVERGQCLC